MNKAKRKAGRGSAWCERVSVDAVEQKLISTIGSGETVKEKDKTPYALIIHLRFSSSNLVPNDSMKDERIILSKYSYGS